MVRSCDLWISVGHIWLLEYLVYLSKGLARKINVQIINGIRGGTEQLFIPIGMHPLILYRVFVVCLECSNVPLTSSFHDPDFLIVSLAHAYFTSIPLGYCVVDNFRAPNYSMDYCACSRESGRHPVIVPTSPWRLVVNLVHSNWMFRRPRTRTRAYAWNRNRLKRYPCVLNPGKSQATIHGQYFHFSSTHSICKQKETLMF